MGCGAGSGVGAGGSSGGGNAVAAGTSTPDTATFAGACQAARTAWSTFQSSYKSANSEAEKNLATTTAAAAYANIAYNLASAALTVVSRNYNAFLLQTDSTTVANDLSSVENDLKADDTHAADAAVAGQVQNDVTNISTLCGS
jgi:hypothetical protein